MLWVLADTHRHFDFVRRPAGLLLLMSPTARTLEWLRDHSIQAQVVERIIPHTRGTKVDLFGCIDIIALPGDHILGIQTTTGDHHAERIAKAKAETRMIMWLVCGGAFEVWSWHKWERENRWKRRVAKASLVNMTMDGEQRLELEFTEEEIDD